MNISSKIHAIKHYLNYALKAKSKHNIQSPFVLNFITKILESNNSNDKTVDLSEFYINNYAKINNNKNKGAGSIVLTDKNHGIQSFIKKTAIPRKYGFVLQALAATFDNKTILELGTSLGISTSYLASNQSNTIHTIEGNSEMYEMTKIAFEKLNVTNVFIHNSTFEKSLDKIAKQIHPISLVFIDGNHKKKPTISYFNSILPYINNNSIIILDDIYWSKEMTEAWNEIRLHEKVRLSIDLYRIGILFFSKEQKEKEDFILWY